MMSSGDGNANTAQSGGDMTGGGQQGQGSQQNPNVSQHQQLQLQQTTQAQANQGTNQMQQLQVIQQPLQNQYLQQLYNTQSQLIMPGNIAFNHQLNPQIQVITAGKTFQPNQLGSPHMLTTATGYTIPTSAANNQAYIIGQLINSSQPSILQQHSQQTKPGEMQKVIQPQITQTHLPQGLTWTTPQFLQNPIFIRGTQPDQMFIQQQQPLHTSTGSHQQFTMPLTATGQLPTSISSTTNGLHQMTQQQNQSQPNQGTQQVQQNQAQNPQPIQPANVMSMKAPATLQPKPPLQIQPSPTNQQQAQHQQHLQQQIQNVTMGGQQFQMIPQQSSQNNVLSQQILAQAPQTITTQVMQPNQPQQLQQQRQLTILPQQTGGQTMQQQVAFIQQQQHQPIRPNYTVTATTATPTSQPQGITTTPVPQQRPKIRKPGVGRGTANNASPGQQAKAMYPRQAMPNSGSPAQIQSKIAQTSQAPTPTGATITRVSVANSMSQQQGIQQPLKTINLSALHTPPSLPDATLTPLIPQSNQQLIATHIQQQQQPLQVFVTTPQMPTPNISITPAPPPKKEDSGTEPSKGGETEKENTKMLKNSQSADDVDDSKQKLPKAMVKPQAQILTHVIEGFVIQEASEPFPPLNKNGDCDEPPKKKMALGGEIGKCEMCGKVDLKAKFKKNKRFCSSACAKGMKAQQHQHQQSVNNSLSANAKSKNKKWGESGDADLTDETSSSIGDTCVSPAIMDHSEDDPKMNPVKWSVAEVVDFVRTLPGCSEYADDFAVQEIDGQALMLLKEDHLMSAIGMKLGPALKLCNKIEALRCPHGGNAEQKV